MRRIMLCLVALVAGSVAVAAPITYEQPMIGPNGNVLGVNTQPAANPTTTAGATYHYFYAQAGTPITVFGDRLAGHYDMSLGVWTGLYADTNDLAFFDANFLAFGDDDDPPNLPGPFGDPNVTFLAPTTGYYTVAVTNFFSSAGPPNPYRLSVLGNTPEPASLAVFGSLVAVGGLVARRRMAKVTA